MYQQPVLAQAQPTYVTHPPYAQPQSVVQPAMQPAVAAQPTYAAPAAQPVAAPQAVMTTDPLMQEALARQDSHRPHRYHHHSRHHCRHSCCRSSRSSGSSLHHTMADAADLIGAKGTAEHYRHVAEEKRAFEKGLRLGAAGGMAPTTMRGVTQPAMAPQAVAQPVAAPQAYAQPGAAPQAVGVPQTQPNLVYRTY